MAQTGPGARSASRVRVASPEVTSFVQDSRGTLRLSSCSTIGGWGRGALEIRITGPISARNRASASQAGRIVGLELEPQPKRYQAIGYGLSTLEQDARSEWDAGLDLRYAITPQMAFSGTINPDFATVARGILDDLHTRVAMEEIPRPDDIGDDWLLPLLDE